MHIPHATFWLIGLAAVSGVALTTNHCTGAAVPQSVSNANTQSNTQGTVIEASAAPTGITIKGVN